MSYFQLHNLNKNSVIRRSRTTKCVLTLLTTKGDILDGFCFVFGELLGTPNDERCARTLYKC